MNKLIPWIVSITLAIALGLVHFHYKDIVAGKDAELQAANEKNVSLTTEANMKLMEANAKVSAANEKANQIASDARNKLQNLATEANEKLQAASQPEPTVLVSFRKALLGSGGVAVVRNTLSESIIVSLVAIRAATNQQKTFELIIDGAKVKEVGEREGWAFLSGDMLKLSQPGHKSVSFTVR